MCRPVLRVLLPFTIIAFASTEEDRTVQKRLIQDDLKYGESGGQNFVFTVGNFYENNNQISAGGRKFPQAYQISSASPAAQFNNFFLRGPVVDDRPVIQDSNVPTQPVYNIVPSEVVPGRILTPTRSNYASLNDLISQTNGILSPNLIRAEVPRSNPPIVGTIGSGSIGYTHLGNGIFAVGSGSLGFAATVPSQTGKGSITARRQSAAYTSGNSIGYFGNGIPHAYPRPIDLNREVTQQN